MTYAGTRCLRQLAYGGWGKTVLEELQDDMNNASPL